MKQFAPKFRSVCLQACVALSSLASLANGSKAPPREVPLLPITPTQFVVNPSTLRTMLLNNNIDIRATDLRVRQAKTNLNIARGDLLPSINLSMITSAAANPATMASSFQVLLPFLVPDKWLSYFQAKDLTRGMQETYFITQLNTFETAYKMYVTILGDQMLKDQLEIDAADWRRIEETTDLRGDLGLATDHDMRVATAQRALAEMRVAKTSKLLWDQKVALGELLLVDPDKIVLAPTELAPLPSETKTKEEFLALAVKDAPEYRQIDNKLKAKNKEKWSKILGFITGASTAATVANGKPDFGSVGNNVTANFNFGGSYFANIQQVNNGKDGIALDEEAVNSDFRKRVFTDIPELPFAKSHFSTANLAESKQRADFDEMLLKYNGGAGVTVTDVLQSRLNIQEATFERIGAQTELAIIRIGLHRLLRTDEFANIKGCAKLAIHKGDDPKRPALICEAEGTDQTVAELTGAALQSSSSGTSSSGETGSEKDSE